ncbi:MAG: prephenate dehydratase [Candidatus Peregrinibacteria bacterium]
MKNPVIGIVGGKGKMGQYFAKFFKNNGYRILISDKRTSLSNQSLAKKADIVIISVPMDQTESVIQKVAPHIKPSSLLMDLTSLKVGSMEAMKKSRGSYLGCHPLFGPTNPIEGQIVVLCQGRGQKWSSWLEKLFKENKVIVKKLNPQKHDKLMAYVQVLSHFNDITLADALRRSKIKIRDFLTYQSPAYRLKLDMMGRILDQDPNLYGNIQIQNPLSQKAIAHYLKSCQVLAKLIEKKDLKAFEKYFKSAADYLGDYRHQAMEESDHLIEAMIGSRPLTSHPLIGNEDIAVLGPKNTYSDLALKRIRPKTKAYYAPSITDVFELVAKGKVKEGLVPIENSLTGSVRETLDELYDKNVWIGRVIAQPIHLALASTQKIPLKRIEVIYSHPQALLQCRQSIQKYCPQALTVPVESTVVALERVKRENQPHIAATEGASIAAIAAPLAAKAVKLTIIHNSVEDDPHNATTFALITKSPKAPKVSPTANQTSIAFHFGRDAAGTLHTVLQDFAEAGINLTKIESRPNPKMRGKYVFYLDFQGRTDHANIKKTLAKIREKVAHLKVLGCY